MVQGRMVSHPSLVLLMLEIPPEGLSQDVYDNVAFVPQVFQIVVVTCFVTEDVDDNTAVVQKVPVAICTAFSMQGTDIQVLFCRPRYLIGQCAFLAIARGGDDDEIIRYDSDAADIQQQDILPLFLGENFNNMPRKL